MDQEIKKEFEDLTQIVKDTFDQMATKEDLKPMATKEDLKAFATKDDLTKGLGKLKLELLDSMDDKLMDLRGDLIILMRGEDQKVVRLIELLKNKNILQDTEVKELLQMQPFSKAA
jgi:hypothetical protein